MLWMVQPLGTSHSHVCFPNVNILVFRMFLCFPLLSIYASVLVNAVRLDEDIDALNGILVDVADTSADRTDAFETDLVRQLISRNASVGEQLSAEEMQRGLLDFLSTASKTAWKNIFPIFKAPSRESLDFLKNAWWRRKKSTSCQKQLGGLLEKLAQACRRSIQKRNKKIPLLKKVFDDLPQKSCEESVQDMFLHGIEVVRALQVCRDLTEKAPSATKPLFEAGYFLKEWIIRLATAKKAAILWAGFWTNVNLVLVGKASDPEGNQSRTSKENLFLFADRIETNTMHPSTSLGRMAEENGNLEDCQGPTENYLKGNMWNFFSFSFVYGMREKNQDLVIALVHKEMDGDRPLDQSILFQHEVPTVGIAAWGLGFWSPHVVVIDLLGTCKQTSSALRKQLYSGLRRYRSFAKGFERREDFVLRSRLSWTCLDCSPSHCHLDEHLAKQIKELRQAKRQKDRKGIALIKAAKASKVSKVKKLLSDGADVNFQDQDGNTALFFAVSLHNANQMANHSGEKATVQALLKRGAHLDAKNKFGETPLMVAQRTLRNLLVKHGGKENAKNFGKASQSTR